MPTGENHLF